MVGLQWYASAIIHTSQVKIVGFTYKEGEPAYTMKCDASLLNGGKPFFMPSWSKDIRYAHCIVARINRLGRCIQPKFASRYYDAMAPGLDFVAWDYADSNWAQATAFDSSLAVGEFTSEISSDHKVLIDQAITKASEWVTLRMGDLVYIDIEEAHQVESNQVIDEAGLFCRIK